MTGLSNTFGIAMRNFTAYPQIPDAQALIDYGVRMEELGFDSLWVWDHILLGVDPHFPIIDALSLLTAVAARTRKIRLGTGILILPLRNPLVLAKQLSSIDQISKGRFILGTAAGWYKREFDAVGVPFEKRGKIMDQNLEIMTRLWTEDKVEGEYPPYNLRSSVMFPKPVQKPRPPILIGGYVDRVLKRAALAGDGWLTYFYTPEGFTKSWTKIRDFAKEGGKDPDSLLNCNQLPIMIGKSRAELEGPMMEWLSKEWDYASWSDSTKESAIMGTVDECVAQLKAHLAVGVQKIIFVPYKYQMDQVEIIAREIIPRLKK
ncbi:TIGR03619 family F420-dependent LLM class oxidoreductase [Rhodospirillaceae bacterium SYSU D60014]|uniref:LLM class flavin-dependent oxidoreductase n=1 Tax=Virgifigura deserti TaxID=2268457 RepID=UPI000E672660